MGNQNIVWHQASVTREQRQKLKGHKPAVLWFTGLSGSGKSTIANAVELKLNQLSVHSYLLDGDNVRHDLNSDLGFSDEDRIENIRRIGEVAKLFVDSGSLVLTAFISPFIQDREQVRSLLPEGEFVEVFVDTPIETCELRDPKGLYKKARKGEIKHFTGLTSDYEAPQFAEIHLKTDQQSIEESAEQVVQYLRDNGYV
ncbi:adenylyl-sulfate kinase [Vibrio breoganii]|uniref:adenylyl-sulfate kinase n=1 Tax=Vibrio breoganii TaxID=553239 RepID=UPI000C832B77|nr:adenylyl-sulfate kinase [Vibrio breoganii]PMG94215.1 adenylyl-sulfate kinase [Vibrio breoganii]PMK70707.1 adenylyl-sulfate kinase [Vibrio breoganii]